VKLRDSGTHGGLPFYVMEAATLSLERLTANDVAGVRVLNESPALMLTFFRQACSAVQQLHAHRVLHRDIKPSNILLMLDGPEPMRAAVCDFGIAANQHDQRNLTGTQEAIGTPIYRAPEAALDKHTKLSDVYSLGKTLEFVFTRVTPAEYSPRQLPRDSRLDSDVWDALDEVLARACALKPSDRYPSVHELIEALPSLTASCVAEAGMARTGRKLALGDDEAVMLATVIAQCPTDRDSVPVHVARNACSLLSDYDSSLAIRRLVGVGFIESFEEGSGNFNDSWFALRPTAAGVAWAVEHQAAMSRAQSALKSAELPSNNDVPGDSDIPF
jgi:serine/threonine protein kinase